MRRVGEAGGAGNAEIDAKKVRKQNPEFVCLMRYLKVSSSLASGRPLKCCNSYISSSILLSELLVMPKNPISSLSDVMT